MALSDNLIAYYKLDETGGNRADSTNNSNAIVETGGSVGTSIGISGKCAFVSASSWLTLPAGICDPSVDRISYSMWFLITQSTETQYFLASGNLPFYFPFYSYLDDRGVEVLGSFWRLEDGGYSFISNNVQISLNEWHHVVLTFDNTVGGTTGRQYFDGVLSGTQTTVSPIASDATSFTLGGLDGSPKYIDELGIWNRVLSGSEVAALYNNGRGGFYPFDFTGTYGGTYYINGQATTLDATGSGIWKLYYYLGGFPASGLHSNVYYINGVPTTLDTSGNGWWNKLLYAQGVVFTGAYNGAMYRAGIQVVIPSGVGSWSWARDQRVPVRRRAWPHGWIYWMGGAWVRLGGETKSVRVN